MTHLAKYICRYNMLAIYLIFLLCGVALASVEDDMKAEFAKIVIRCAKENPVDFSELWSLRKMVVPTKPEVKCLLDCAYRKVEIFDDKGMYNVTRGYELADKAFNTNAERLASAKQLADACVTVNDKPVSENSKDCDRAGHLFKCGVDNVEKARTDEEIKEFFTKQVMTCTQDHPVEMSELMQLQALVTPKTKESKCLLACAYRAIGILNAKGEYDKERAYKTAEEEKNGDDKREANGKKLADICAKTNEVEVSDKEKGCERAALIFKCVIENAPKLGFKV